MILHRLYRRFSPAAQSSFVLMYHRIAEEGVDPWNNCVSPPVFAGQLQWLQQHYRIVPLTHLVEGWQRRTLQPRSIALTFDDGYADNAAVAKPLLEAMGVPATFFLTNERRSYWWDEVEARILKSDLPADYFEFSEDGASHRFDLSGEEKLTPELLEKLEGWKGQESAIGKRAALYLALVRAIRRSTVAGRERLLDQVRAWNSVEVKTPPVIDQAIIASIARNPLFTIGAHTVSHPVLSVLSATDQEREISANIESLQEITGHRVGLLAYPHGAYNSDTLQLLKKYGVKAAFNTRHHSLRYASNAFEIGRYHMPNTTDISFLPAANLQSSRT